MVDVKVDDIKYDFKQRGTKGRIYVSSNLTDLVDNFYSDNEIYLIPFKSKVWSKVKRKANSVIAQILQDIPGVCKASYSRTAGCQCGCSPGYLIQGDQWWKKYTWATLTFDDQTIQDFTTFLNEMKPKLEAEKVSGLNTIPA